MLFSVAVDVMPRSEISDPAGQTIERSLPSRGFSGITGVRVGKRLVFELDAEDEQQARQLVTKACERILTNPIIEEFTFEVTNNQGAER